MKGEKTGFTLVELLTVLAIITLLVGLLIPSLTLIRNTAKEAKQKSQLTEIGLALTGFRNDYGDYPPSYWMPPPGTGPPGPPATDYCGAQKLAEALLGRDLLGFHPKSDWSATNLTFYPEPPPPQNLEERKGPYLALATTNAFKLGDLYGPALTASPLNADRFVICDSFGVKKITIAPGQTARAGTPILYYRANTASKTIEPPAAPFDRIYNIFDNVPLASQLNSIADSTKAHQLGNPANMQVFYNYIRDLKVTAKPWPYRPDSYLLISAGADGLYGTKDDICNFGN